MPIPTFPPLFIPRCLYIPYDPAFDKKSLRIRQVEFYIYRIPGFHSLACGYKQSASDRSSVIAVFSAAEWNLTSRRFEILFAFLFSFIVIGRRYWKLTD